MPFTMPCSETDENTGVGINELPDELILSVFKYLPLEAILTCDNVCFRWKKIVKDQTLWRNLVIVYSNKPGDSEVCKQNLELLKTHSEDICCIKLQYIYDYSFIMSILKNCKNLISLELVMCRVTDDFVDDVKMWPKLKKLNMKNSVLLSGKDLLIKFDDFVNLNFLSLADFGLSTVSFGSLLQCTYLSHIFIEKIKYITINDVEMLIISRQRILQVFHIYGGFSIDDTCIQLLTRCPLLTDLAIIRCENLSDVGLLSLIHLKCIKHLQIWNNKRFSEMNLLRTLGSPNLVKLNSLSLSRIRNISPVVVDVISEYYKNLKFLALYQCPKIINTDYEKQLKSKFKNIDVVLN